MRRFASTLLVMSAVAAPLGAQDSIYKPSMKSPDGKQILAVYLGAQTCGPCLLPEVKAAVKRFKGLVAEQAKKSGATFSVIGASSDWDQTVAANFLADVGPFDQVSLGSQWTNLAFEQFVWRLPGGETAMPQILILERTVRTEERGITFSEPKVLRRVSGSKDIPAWVAQGAPISQ